MKKLDTDSKLVALAGLCVTTIFATSAMAQQQLPFKGTLTGAEVYQVEPPNTLILNGTGSGNAIALLAGATAGAQSVTGSPRDQEAIQQIVTTFDQTWGSDPVTYAAQYGDVIDWVGPSGNVLTDPAAITDLYTFLFTNVFAGTTRVSTIRNLTFLTGTLAVLDIHAQILGFGLGALERNVLIKRGGEWRILLHQQTLITP